jgi:hypothetical protein
VPFLRWIDSDARPPGIYGALRNYPFINDGWQTGFGDIGIAWTPVLPFAETLRTGAS